MNYFVTRDEARATAASSALSRILQGAVKLPSKEGPCTEIATQNNLQAAGGNAEELPLGEGMVGQGSRGSKGADEVELMTKARGSLFSSSKQGGGAPGGDDGAVGISVKREGEVGREDLLPHGIQGMEDFGKWSPRWSRREDFGIREVKELAKGFHNFGI